MITIIVDGNRLEFPDNTPPDEIREIIEGFKAKRPDVEGSVFGRTGGMFGGGGPEMQAMGAGMVEGAKAYPRAFGAMEATPDEAAEYKGQQIMHPEATFTGEMVGETLPAMAAGGATRAIPAVGRFAAASPKVARYGGAALTGGLEAGLVAKGKGADMSEAITAAGLGAGGGFLMQLGTEGLMKVFQKVMNRSAAGRLINPDGTPTPEMDEALRKAGLTIDDLDDPQVQKNLMNLAGEMEPEAATRKAFLESQGLQGEAAPTKAQVTRQADDWIEQQDAFKGGKQVRGRIENQQGLIRDRWVDQGKEIAPGAGAARTSGHPVADHALNKNIVHNNRIKQMYDFAAENTGGEAAVDPTAIIETLQGRMPDDMAAGGNITSFLGWFKRNGILGDDGEILRNLTVKEAESFVKGINKRYSPTNSFGNMMGREAKDAMDDAVTMAGGEDLYRQARKEKARWHGELKGAKASPFGKRDVSIVRDIIEEKIDPQDLVKELKKSRYRDIDIEQLKNYLHKGGPVEKSVGTGAWRELQADVLDDIFQMSKSGAAGTDEATAITRHRLEKAVQKYGWPKLSKIFDQPTIKFLKDMIKVTKLLEPPPGTALGSGPSGRAVEKGTGLLARHLKGAHILIGSLDVSIDPGARVLRVKAKYPAPTAPANITGAIGGQAGAGTEQIFEEEK